MPMPHEGLCILGILVSIPGCRMPATPCPRSSMSTSTWLKWFQRLSSPLKNLWKSGWLFPTHRQNRKKIQTTNQQLNRVGAERNQPPITPIAPQGAERTYGGRSRHEVSIYCSDVCRQSRWRMTKICLPPQFQLVYKIPLTIDAVAVMPTIKPYEASLATHWGSTFQTTWPTYALKRNSSSPMAKDYDYSRSTKASKVPQQFLSLR